jgi:hypothetical protein
MRMRTIRCDKGHAFRFPLYAFVGWCQIRGCGSDRLEWLRYKEAQRTGYTPPWSGLLLNDAERISSSYMPQGKSDLAQATNGTTPDNDNRNPGK